MKKTRKVLSIALAILVVFASLPVVYTAATDAVTYAAGETGTIDNPTHPVSADGVFSYDDLYKLNIDVENTKYTFYQTMNDEYFTYTQILGLQQRNDVPISGRTFNFVGVEHYTGGTNATTTNADGSAQGTDLMEVPAITTNTTADFLNTYYVPTHTWAAINNNASELGSAPSNVQLAGSVADLSGCKNYSWSDTYVIKGLSASEKGEVNTGYYEAYKWNWSTSDASAAFELRLKTSIRILDARVLAEELAKAEAILANSDEYTDAYISSVQATVNTIPEDLRDFSAVYSQSDIDKYAEMLEDVSLNSADYTEFNRTYENLKSITNALDAFTDDSFSAFKVEIEKINNNLPKNLDYTKQETVNQATQALKDAYNLLVHKGTQNTASSSSSDAEDVTFVVGNDFKFIQIEDNQLFSFTQPWTIYRGSKSSNRKFYSALDTSDSATNTFISKLSTVATNQTISTDAVKNGLSGAAIFTSWEEVTSTGELKDDSEVIDRTTGRINASYDGFQDGQTYYLENSPVFTGLSSTETGEHTYTFKQNMYVSYTAWFSTTYGTSSVTTTLTITDARPLVKAVAEANATIANPGSYSDNYISALQAAVDAVPVNLIRGVEYYTQEEVDAYLNAITSVQEGCADYSEFNEAYEELINMKNNSTYTDESFDAFMEEIQNINKNLPKNLTADQQATVDAATEALHKATHHLVYYKLNTDNVFTEEDIPEDLGNSPLVFSVSSTKYEFMQVSDGQQFAIRTDFSARNNDSSYTLRLLSFGFSTVNSGNVTTICDARSDPDKGCHNAGNIPSENFFDLATYASTSGTITGITSYTADDAGDTGEFNSWVNTDGVSISSGGVFIDGAELELSDSTGYATYVYTATSDEAQANININYAFRLGWSYEQFWGETIRRHAHIPVSLTITDARNLHSLYEEVKNILEGKSDSDYTFDSLVNLYNVFAEVPADMADGSTYYTQTEVDTQYAALKSAYDSLVTGADYSEYFEAYVEAEKIMNSGNDDGYGNKIYTEETYNKLVDKVTSIHNGLDKNLSATEENQATIDFATLQIKEAIAAAEASKYADYTALEEAIIKAEKIAAAEEGTYTEETLEALREALNNANNLDRALSTSEQATVDAITSQLEAAIADMEFKADYSEFDDAYSKVQDIFNNPNKYTDETVDAAEKALEEADKLNKDLSDTEENRTTIENATNALENVFNNAKESADYTAFEEAYKKVQEIAENKDGKYTSDSVTMAQNALVEADKLDKNLEKNDANQTIVNNATSALQSVIDNAQLKADYTGYDEAYEALEDILNNKDNYTQETVDAAQAAKDAADALGKDQPATNQDAVNEVIAGMQNVVTNAQEKANYDGYDDAYAEIENILNNKDNYTQDTVDAAQAAKNAADALGKDQPATNQDAVNEVIAGMQNVVTNAQEKANYDAYNNAKTDADSIVNDDGNGNPIYDEDAFNAYKEAVNSIDTALDKDLPSSEQTTVDNAVTELESLKATLEAKKYYTVTFKDVDGNVLGTSSYVNGDVFGNLTAPALPEDTETTAYVGWVYADGTLAKADDVVSGDMDVTVASEAKKLIAKDESGVSIDEITSFVSGIEAGTTVEEVLSKFDNDELVIEIKTYEGVDLASEELVGTGSTITLKSKYTGVVYETRMFIIMGDVDGDGDIDDTDFDISKSVGFESYTYPDEHNYFFIANDIDENGIINVLDAFYIGRMKTV